MKELRDQSAHFFAALIAIAPVVVWPNPLTGALAGFALGMVREITEEGEVSFEAARRALGSRLDLTFWTLGGFFAGLGGL